MRKVKDILFENGFKFNHKLGQNFITDINFLNKIVGESGVTPDDVVVEIGTGAGTLTRALAQTAAKVYTFEVDRNLEPVLAETLSGLNNVELYFNDVLKMSDDELKSIVGAGFTVTANIPYYITTPLIMRFLESGLKPKSVTVMIQKEVADRLVAKCGTADYGAITMAVDLYGDARLVDRVSRNMFYPVPKVDSALVRIDLYDKFPDADKDKVKKFIKCCFSMRRKTLVNNMSACYGLSKSECADILNGCGFDARIRGETLSVEDVIKIVNAKIFSEALKKKI